MTSQEMIDAAHTLDRDGLLALYDRITDGDTPGWAPGRAFEHLVLRAFELEGAEVQWPFEVPMPTSERAMEQIDGVLYVTGLALLVETKDTAEQVNIEPIAKIKSQLDRRPPQTLGLVVSRGGFTVPAKTLTSFISGGRIILWTGGELRFALAAGRMVPGLIRKYRHLVERAMPDLTITPPTPLVSPVVLTGDTPDGPDDISQL